MGGVPRRHGDLDRRVQDVSIEVTRALGHFDEALDLLAMWVEEYPGTHLARASRNLIGRNNGGGL